MEPSREIMWNIGRSTFLDAGTVGAGTFLLLGLGRRCAAWRRGRKGSSEIRRGRVRASLRAMFIDTGMLRGRNPRLMHSCVLYGALALVCGTGVVALDMHFGTGLLRGTRYLAFSLLLDGAGIALLVGIALAAHKRYVVKPDRLDSGAGDALVLALIAAVVMSGFLVEGLRIVATRDPWARWSPAGQLTAFVLNYFIDVSLARKCHVFLWHGHVALSLTLVALIPWTKLLHSVAVPLNVYLSRPQDERAGLPAPADPSRPGVETVSDCTRKQLIETDACLECGRCKKLCAIFQSGQTFAPAALMKNLRGMVRAGRWEQALVGSAISQEALWSCTGCGSCDDRCPMDGEHVARIVDIRRAEVSKGRTPQAIVSQFHKTDSNLEAWRGQAGKDPANADIYVWPGCRGNESEDKTIPALLRLIERAGMTATVLAPPSCCGGPIRRLGNEALFERAAAANIEYLKRVPGAPIVTPCPHCFNTLTNEYRPYGSEFEVMHHTQFLAQLLEAGKLTPEAGPSLKVAFHDPCFLGRYNAEYSAPRKLLASAEGVVLQEMKFSKKKSACCGSGGGTVQGEVASANARKRIRRAVQEGVEAVITGCPYCRESLKAGAQAEPSQLRPAVLDVAEFLGERSSK